MTLTFADYTNIQLRILKFVDNKQSLIDKKAEILNNLFAEHTLDYDSVLYIGFNPSILASKFKKIYITECTDESRQFLSDNNIPVIYLPYDQLITGDQRFECVVAIDEFTTFAVDESDQIEKLSLLCDLTDKLLVTSTRDYKNLDYKTRDLSIPCTILHDQLQTLFIEHHNYDYQNRYSWISQVYELTGSEMIYHGCYNRRAIFFKQMANHVLTENAKHFNIHKNLMYRSLLRKNYEHLISVTF